MYYTLSKVLPALIMPLSVLFFTGLGFLIFRKSKFRKHTLILFYVASVVTYLFSLSPISNYLVVEAEREWIDFVPDSSKKDVVIVLGGIMSDGYKHTYEFTSAVDRLLTGIRYVKQGKADKIMLSGGRPPISGRTQEAHLMYAFIKEFNLLPDSVIILENRSSNTVENAEFSKEIIVEEGLSSSVYVVTSASHMTRAKHQFELQGFDVSPVPTDYALIWESSNLLPFWLIPNAHALATNSKYFREWLGTLYHTLF